ncbi:hypothetical protein PC116_g20308 [Phytophthora cactorum]|uniref:Uncharacterized protein n=1 Tax=Phytophthora cactorum TaxID=29920 RepID=A0A8T1FJ93_9STRA|nr:hypothetical protein PC118_g14772 [Phytophthora cactorum]KAG2982693.1 hypothetical protein PC120_g24592 [Phytophthora cactorum]KAG4231421.1 hypothetical protein PC116_g20308 [Phytophthora cactorum]
MSSRRVARINSEAQKDFDDCPSASVRSASSDGATVAYKFVEAKAAGDDTKRREGRDVVLVCVPKDVNACEKSVLSSGPTAFELRISTSSASVPSQDDSRQLRGR